MAARREDGRRPWEVFQLVGDWLKPCFSEHRIDLPPTLPAWPHIIEMASGHLVAPAVGFALARSRDAVFPDDASQYFGAVLALNRERNTRVLDTLARVLQVLNSKDIVPMLLKGGAMLADEAYPDSGIRVIVDLDFLLPDPTAQVAFDALLSAGFYAGRFQTPEGYHHLPALVDRASGVRVEIHRRPMGVVGRLADGDVTFARGRPIVFRSCKVLVPSATDHVIHGIAHSQVNDHRYWRGVPHLRQLLDCAVLRSRHDADIDWPEVARRFDRSGYGSVLADNLAQVEVLLGQPEPAVLGGHGAAARARMKRAFELGVFVRTIRSTLWRVRDAAQRADSDPAGIVRRSLAALSRENLGRDYAVRHTGS